MTDDEKLIRPKGATKYDILGMGDEDFETMCGRLIRLEHPEAFKPANTSDGGADMVLPRTAGDGYERCWQEKHYPKAINWTKCDESLAAARKHWDPEHYTFVFPRELTVGEQKTFDKHFRGPDAEIKVDHWTGERLQERLLGSDEGQRVARPFFPNVELEHDRTIRAIEAGGRLDTPQDAADRLLNIGGFLASSDPFFSYPAATHETEGPGPPVTPGAVMSFEASDGTVSSRVDIVPRDAEAMERYGPQFAVEPADTEAGRRAAERLQEALREGKPFEIGEGLDLTLTRMPPALKDFVGQRLSGGVMSFGEPTRVRPEAQPWKARVHVITDEGDASLDIQLAQVKDVDVPEGWDDAFSGSYGGLTVTMALRALDPGGEANWNFQYSRDNSPVREQLAALRLVKALSGTGEFVVSGRGKAGLLPELRIATSPEPFPADTQALLAFLEDVRVIEEWAGVEYRLPETISRAEAQNVASVAHIVRNQGRSLSWNNVKVTVLRSGLQPLRDGRLIRVEMQAAAALFGREVALGHTRVDFSDYVIAAEQPAPGQPDHVMVRIEPGSDAGAKVFEHLVKRKTATRPPPPPPRKGKGKKGKKRRR